MANQRPIFASGALMAALLVAGCSSPDGTPYQAGTGAIIGGLTGAAAGSLIGGNPEATVIGGALGAIVGGAIGTQLDTQERELRQSLAGSGAAITNTGRDIRVIFPDAVTFRTNSSVVDPAFRSSMRALSDSLQRHPNSRIRVVGHTDNVGTAAYNNQLSQERAMAVARELISSGTSDSRITVTGRGLNEPIASNASAAGRAENRRVEIVITPTN